MTKVISRQDVKDKLIKWQLDDIDAKQVHEWAENSYNTSHVEYEDWEDDEYSVTNSILAELDMLNINLLTKEDIPALIEFLDSPPGKFKESDVKFQRYMRSIDIHERKSQLADIDIYSEFCGT